MLGFDVRIICILRTLGSQRFLHRRDHLHTAIQTGDVDFLRGSDAHSAARADVFAAGAFLRNRGSNRRSAVGSGSSNLKTTEFVSVDQNIGQVVIQNEFQKLVAGGSVTPAVFLAVLDDQPTRFRRFLEFAVVVGSVSAAILDAVDEVVIVDHFVKERRGDLFDGSGERSSADVDFVGLAKLGDPGVVPQREVSVSARRGLNGDGGP